jgi:hypothetical protein
MPIPLREGFDAASLRAMARESRDAGQTRRRLALAAIRDGATRSAAARIGGVTLQIVRGRSCGADRAGLGDDAQRARPAGLIDRKAPGQPRRLDDYASRASKATIPPMWRSYVDGR